MDVSLFISSRVRFRRRIVTVSIAISFFVMIIAVAISSGFRYEIRAGLADITGDIQIVPPDMNVMDEDSPIERYPSYLNEVLALDGVKAVVPVIYRAGVVKCGDDIYGVLFKGMERDDSTALSVSIPSGFASKTSLGPGDNMLAYFIGDKLKMRRFNVTSVHDVMVETDANIVIQADLEDLQRLSGWEEGDVSSLEIILDDGLRNEDDMHEMTMRIGTMVNAYSEESEAPVIAVSSLNRYPQIFDWLDLIDFNVFFILILMTIVAGFNMISGLLIMLFENISLIGILKALGMTDKAIAKVFLSSSAVLVGKGMLAGNALALILCFIQMHSHLIPLNPANYFVSYVPASVDMGMILLADAAAFIVIMLLLLIPCMFITKVDPAETVKMQ